MGIVCQRDDKSKEGKANALGVDNIGGVFVVLLFGLAFAVFTAIYEFVWHSRKLAKNSRVSVISVILEFVCHIFNHKILNIRFRIVQK